MIRSVSVLVVAALLTLLAGAGGEADGQSRFMGGVVTPQVVIEGAVSPAGRDAAGAVATASLVIRNAKVVTIDRDNPRAAAVVFSGEEVVYHRNGTD